jgi:hypothetical protein
MSKWTVHDGCQGSKKETWRWKQSPCTLETMVGSPMKQSEQTWRRSCFGSPRCASRTSLPHSPWHSLSVLKFLAYRAVQVRDVDAAESVWKGTDLASFYVVVLTGHLRLLFKDATIEELVRVRSLGAVCRGRCRVCGCGVWGIWHPSLWFS